MYKLFLPAFILSLFFSAKLSAQKPNISYPGSQTFYVGKSIIPLKPGNNGGAIPNTLYPKVSKILNSTVWVDDFVRLPSGDIYAVGSYSIIHIKTDGTYSPFVGSGTIGYADGLGAAASFGDIGGITSDAAGNLYVTENNPRDELNSRVRKITPAGLVSTYAQGLRSPRGIVIDANGIIYVIEHPGRIMKIAKDGTIAVLAGHIGSGSIDGDGANASFNFPGGLAIDKAGNLYVADLGNSMIRKVTPTGLVTTFAGSTTSGDDDGIGTAATFNYPESIKVDSKGYIIVGQHNGVLRKITPIGEVYSIPAGPYYDDNGQVVYQSFSQKIVLDENDNIIAPSGNGFDSNGFYKIGTTGYNVSPALPAGLALGPDGTISGTPTTLSAATQYRITASNASGMSTAVINLQVVLSSDPPVISSFSPTAGYPGTVIIITGNYFTGTTDVSIGGKQAYYDVSSPTSITAYVPTDATSGEISVTTPRGSVHAPGFTLIPPPVISAVSSLLGYKGSTITITGTGFTNVTQVTFGGYYASFKIISPTQIEAVLGDGASGNVFISAPSGTASFPGFTYIGLPVISSVSPASAGAGATITINGSDFNNATLVKFGNTAATSYTVVSPTKITAVVAAATKFSNGVTITTPAGSSTYNNFSFVPKPIISQVSPIKGGYNSPISIWGTNLIDAKQVTIGGVPASVIYNYDNQIYVTVGAGATSGDIVVVTTGGTITYPGFIAVPAPTITSITPQTAGAGEDVIITGTNFTEVNNVSFGGVNAAFAIASPTTIVATVGYGSTGAVTVFSPGGSASVPGFVHKGPVVTSFSPVHAGVGETVVIKGSNFSNATTVSFGGVPATSFTVNSSTQISAVVGEGRSGNVTVTTQLGKGSLAGFNHPGPAIAYFNPTYAGPSATAPVTITGANFTGATAVSFGGVPAASFTVVSASTITAIPATTSTSGDVVVTTPQGTDKLAGFTWATTPVITSFSPSSQRSGAQVTITGSNFIGVTAVKFGGIPASYYYATPTSIVAAVGNNGASGDIVVSAAGGTATKSGFTYTSPTITAIAPVLAATGQTVVITGTNLDGIQFVRFGDTTNAASFTIVSSKEIRAVVGTGASGTVRVTGAMGTAVIDGFIYLAPPVIYGLTPTSGGNGTIMAINGSNLTSTSEVKIGGIPATIINVTNNQVTAKIGSGATGKVSLKTIAGTAEFEGFTWYPAPTITSISPLSANAQTTVTINGTNFTGVTQLQFGSSLTNFTIVSPTQITTQPTNGSSGDITITSPGGTAVFPGFTFLPAPVITSFIKSGDGSDAEVTITGSNFNHVTGVKFGGVAAASYQVLSPTSISAKPGSGATGAITVTGDGGTASLLGYLYDSPPAITSFAPAFGPIGTTLAIEGDNFNISSQKNVVFFGPVQALVKSATKTHLEVTVPAGANDLITVTNLDKKLSASSNLPFLVTNTSGTASYSNKLDLKFLTGLSRYIVNDFDGDGNPDLLIAKDDSIYILKHGSDPMLSKSSFTQKVVLQAERQSGSMVVGDVDGDGKMDILYSNTSIILLHNTSTNGNISFEQRTLENLDGTLGSMTLRDMNLDGRPDLVLYDDFTISCYPNTTTGSTISFGPLMWLQNTSSSGTISSALTDIDGDNKPDPIGGSSYSGISIFKNNSVPGDLSSTDFPLTYFTHSGYYYTASEIATGDFDGDGKADIVEEDFSAHVLLISRNIAKKGIIDASSLDQAKPFSNSSMAFNPTVADVDGDGKIDLVALSGTGVYYARNQSTPGNISLAGPAILIPPDALNNSVNVVKLNDMDSDGRMDLMLIRSGSTGTTFSIYHNGPAVVPQITAVTPLTGKTGTKVTITGEHFDGTTVVKFGSKVAQSFTVDSSQSIVAIVGEGETGDISIQTPNGPAAFPGFIFIPAPVITTANPLANGTLVINGSNFTKATSVTIAGISASSFTVNSDNKITASFPTVSGELTVTTPGGSATLAGVTITATSHPVTNLKLAANSVTCKGQNNGSISITAEQSASYTAIITGNGLNNSSTFSTATSINNLSPGTYNVCVTDAALVNYKQCFDLVITEPKDLSILTVVNETTNMVSVTMDGGSSYDIKLNGVSYKTSDNTISLPLSRGSNTLVVSTDKICQGIIQRIINNSGTLPYPNPFQNTLNFNIGKHIAAKTTLKIYSLNTGSQLKLIQDYTNQSGVISMDVSSLDKGVYSLNVTIDGKESVYKIIK
jgi:hypothetical protein